MKKAGQHGPRLDPRFTLHHRQPRADKLDARQRRLCHADGDFKDALRKRVASEERFSAFIDGTTFYIALEGPCARCSDFRKRTRDRSCYRCHLNRGAENFERMRAGLAPRVMRTKDSHRDLLDRERAEREGKCDERKFGSLTVKRWPTGRLEVLFPDGHREHDLAKCEPRHVYRLMDMLPELKEALIWAGWYKRLSEGSCAEHAFDCHEAVDGLNGSGLAFPRGPLAIPTLLASSVDDAPP